MPSGINLATESVNHSSRSTCSVNPKQVETGMFSVPVSVCVCVHAGCRWATCVRARTPTPAGFNDRHEGCVHEGMRVCVLHHDQSAITKSHKHLTDCKDSYLHFRLMCFLETLQDVTHTHERQLHE